MSDSYSRISGDATPVGYRPLPGYSNSNGPELKTLVFATLGVALGIVAGAVLAGGSSRVLLPSPAHTGQAGVSGSGAAGSVTASSGTASSGTAGSGTVVSSVVTSSSDAASTNKAEDSPVPPFITRPPEPQSHTEFLIQPANPQPAQVTQYSVAATSVAAGQAASQATAHAVAPSRPALVAATTRTAHATAPAHPLSSAPQQRSLADARPAHRALSQQVSLAHKRRLERRLARRAAWRKAHPNYHPDPRAAYKLAAFLRTSRRVQETVEPEQEADPTPAHFAFKIEGSARIASYDPVTGRVETYEGATFILDQPVSAGGQSEWLDTLADLHYSCNEFSICTLAHPGSELLTARRAR